MEQLIKPTKRKTIEINIWLALSVVAGLVLSGLVTGAFTAARIANSDHFTLVSATEDIAVLKENSVTKEVFEVKLESIELKIDTVQDQLTRIENKL